MPRPPSIGPNSPWRRQGWFGIRSNREKITLLRTRSRYVAKNTGANKLTGRCIPRREQGRWHRLRGNQAGARLHGSFDGQTVFDVKANSYTNNGPGYGFGRSGLRHMCNTALRYRNLVVHQCDDVGKG